MPSRTYIQMIWKLYNNGKLPFLRMEKIEMFNKYVAVLENHPEAIEEIVLRRVNMIKYTKTILPQIEVSYWDYQIFERCILDSMFMAELIEPPMFNDFDIKPNLSSNFNRIVSGFEPFNGVIVSVN